MINIVLTYVYLLNLTFLINHEIDSAYWNEWKLFKLKIGVKGFLIMHFPVLIIFLYGLIEVSSASFIGIIFSFLISIIGLGAMAIHTYFIKKGNEEFKTPISQFILKGIFIISIGQFILTIFCYVNNFYGGSQ